MVLPMVKLKHHPLNKCFLKNASEHFKEQGLHVFNATPIKYSVNDKYDVNFMKLIEAYGALSVLVPSMATESAQHHT